MNVEEEVGRLKEEIQRLGKPQPDGSYKKRKVLTYDGELLLQGVHDNVEIILKPEATASDAVAKS
ncbi:hypothetical protein DH2020_030591 [Rehmannia glutinosa]|uniref:Costars domain-containing protein n=1 Tax=Rehmannia glutinosa TaxID=99300 RepID=A0ABR0VKD8_REHGL